MHNSRLEDGQPLGGPGRIPDRPSSLRTMNDLELGWVAGFLEGEGSFCLKRSRTDRPRASIQATSTDEDSLLRLAAYTGIGTVTGPYAPAKDGNKKVWKWGASFQADATSLLHALRPLMGTRRGARIDEVLQASKPSQA